MNKKLDRIIKNQKSDQLESIINKVPPATVSEAIVLVEEPIESNSIESKSEDRFSVQHKNIDKTPHEKLERVVAHIPYTLKRQIKQYLVDHPGETEKTVILKGLRMLGFNVSEEDMIDWRGKKSK